MKRNGKQWRRRTVVVEGEAFSVVWDGRRGAPSLLPDDYPAIDGTQSAIYHPSDHLRNRDGWAEQLIDSED